VAKFLPQSAQGFSQGTQSFPLRTRCSTLCRLSLNCSENYQSTSVRRNESLMLILSPGSKKYYCCNRFILFSAFFLTHSW